MLLFGAVLIVDSFCLLAVHNLDIDVLTAQCKVKYEGWNFNSGNYLFTTDTK